MERMHRAEENQFDLIIHGGLLVSSEEIVRQDVFIDGEKVARLGLDDGSAKAIRRIDAAGKYVFPGLIDAHCHPVHADKMDTLSQSAAFGGITTLIPFSGSAYWGSRKSMSKGIAEFIQQGQEQSLVDFGIHLVIIKDDLKDLKALVPEAINMGILSFKAFMTYSQRGRKLEDNELLMLMDILREHGGLCMIHAENGTIIDYLVEKFKAEGKTTPEYLLKSQPSIVESEAVYRVLGMASLTGCPIYLPHLSALESLDVIRWFRSKSDVKLFAETCIHYLTLTDEDTKKRGTLFKVGPVLKSSKDIEALWHGIEEGLIDVVATDYAGRYIKNKEPIWEKVFDSPHGLPVMEELLPVLYDEGINRGRITLPRLVKITSEMPAKIFGLYPPKGAIKPGFDADLVIFNPSISHIITSVTQHKKVDYTIYEGRSCLGTPVLTMRRGKILVEENQLVAQPGDAKYIPGSPKSALSNA